MATEAQIATTELWIPLDEHDDDPNNFWMCATVTTVQHNGRYSVFAANIPEEFMPLPRYYADENKAMREHFRQVQFVREMVADVAEEQPKEITYYPQPAYVPVR